MHEQGGYQIRGIGGGDHGARREPSERRRAPTPRLVAGLHVAVIYEMPLTAGQRLIFISPLSNITKWRSTNPIN